ncbi:ATP-binding response regulator [Azospirillum soli]|uniref:ATP-binding response regulator n=1 Tax=Azospirillum soli TaxID=1304799 RepID=UPI001AE4D6CF|nr:hybrid sensor histidine kinase/response regulator [Azospirillum soli]MBP2316483.1 signal transduction histidine kinase/CheY-like chemotaxis protein [Azospirillum soli]
MPSVEELLKERDELRSRLSVLDQELEQALVAAEDARERADRLAAERVEVDSALEAHEREAAALRSRLAEAQREAADLAGRLERLQGELLSSRAAKSNLGKPDPGSNLNEELQDFAEHLEQANASLERRVHDRTAELANAFAALRERDERLHFAQTAAGAGMWDWHIARGSVVWSRECYELCGIPPGSIEPSLDGWLSAILPEDRPAAEASIQRILRNGDREFRAEFRILHPAKGLRWIAGRGRVLERDPDGRPQRLIGLIFDVTETKHLEDELRRAKETAERADRAKTQFLAAASHDLRQPIQAAALYAELLRRHAEKIGVADLFELLQASIASLHSMLNGLLDLSRLEAGVVEPAPVNFDPDPLLFRLVSEFRAEAQSQKVELRCRPFGQPILTDPQMLDRILRNLVSNAIKHGASSGSGGAVLIACRRRADHAEFQVWDNGPGIPPEHLDTIFEEFHQLNNPERSSTKGFGLGLSIVARMARLLGLRVGVRSVVGRGSLFTVSVPLAGSAVPACPVLASPAPAPATAPSGVTPLTPDFAGHVALVVEDDDNILKGMSMMLEDWGIRVVAAHTPDELASRLDGVPAVPSVIIADHRLPGGATGRTVVEMVRRRWKVPAIIVTGDTAPERLREAKSIGCRLMHKPVQPRELAETLARVIREGRAPCKACGAGG